MRLFSDAKVYFLGCLDERVGGILRNEPVCGSLGRPIAALRALKERQAGLGFGGFLRDEPNFRGGVTGFLRNEANFRGRRDTLYRFLRNEATVLLELAQSREGFVQAT